MKINFTIFVCLAVTVLIANARDVCDESSNCQDSKKCANSGNKKKACCANLDEIKTAAGTTLGTECMCCTDKKYCPGSISALAVSTCGSCKYCEVTTPEFKDPFEKFCNNLPATLCVKNAQQNTIF